MVRKDTPRTDVSHPEGGAEMVVIGRIHVDRFGTTCCPTRPGVVFSGDWIEGECYSELTVELDLSGWREIAGADYESEQISYHSPFPDGVACACGAMGEAYNYGLCDGCRKDLEGAILNERMDSGR